MANITPKEQAQSVLAEMQKNTNDEAQTIQCALIAISALIAEHTWASPISWNNTRKKYWEAVKNELLNLKK